MGQPNFLPLSIIPHRTRRITTVAEFNVLGILETTKPHDNVRETSSEPGHILSQIHNTTNRSAFCTNRETEYDGKRVTFGCSLIENSAVKVSVS